MYYKEICRYSFYFLHMSFIFSSFIGIFFTWKIMILQGVTIISWKINNNNCILTQMEDYFFEESIIDLYFNYINVFHKDKFILTDCRHAFHEDCIRESMKRTNICPMCRKEINYVDYQRVGLKKSLWDKAFKYTEWFKAAMINLSYPSFENAYKLYINYTQTCTHTLAPTRTRASLP